MKTFTFLPPLILTICTLAAEKANILFLFTDDQCYETIAAHGFLDIETPNMDKLVERGATFTHAYNMGSWTGAICAASRSSIMTGASVWKAGKAVIEVEEGRRKGWGQFMVDAGYDTYMTGKWHVPGLTAEKAFQVTENIRPGMPRALGTKKRPVKGISPEKAWKPWDESQKGFWEGGKHWTEVTADDCIGYLKEASGKENPFFMYVAFNAPHDPRQSPKEFLDKYPSDRIALPESFQPQYADMGNKGVPYIRDENLCPFPRTEKAVKMHRAEYFALITHLDEHIGRILTTLEETGQMDNTWIIFTSDHGLAVGHHGLLGKQNMYEHSLRPPFLISGPGVEAGKVVTAPIYLQDAMATSLEIAGVEIPENVDFKSVLPLLEGTREKNYDSIYGGYMKSQRALIKEGWKIIVYPRLNKQKLFHLTEDPQEMKDLSASPKHADKLAEMRAQLELKMDEMSDPLKTLDDASQESEPATKKKGKKKKG